MATDGYTCALRLLATLPASVQMLVSALPSDLLGWQPAPDSWSIRDVLAHLVDAETLVTRPRIEQMIREDHPLLAVAPLVAPAGDPEQLLAAWVAARAANLPFFRALTAEQLARTGRHPSHGVFTVRDLVIELAYHDQDHLQQIGRIVQAVLYPDMHRFYALYPPPA
jgi:hypothetical protein